MSRYTTLQLKPSEADADPMAVVVQVHFPRGIVHTVGDTVRYLSLRTGYTPLILRTLLAPLALL